MVAEGQIMFNNNVVITKNKSEKEILEVANLETKGKSIIKENIATSSIISSKTVELKGETVIEDNIFDHDGDSAVIYVLEDTFKIATLSIINNTSKIAGQIINGSTKIVAIGDMAVKENVVVQDRKRRNQFVSCMGRNRI